MLLAQKAGIKVFGTGGLGGVHRGGQETMDISADLTELGRTSVAVISSGCKSFLDIPRTLEYLETQGVGVFTFADGRTGGINYPAFYTRDSGVPSPMVVQNAEEAAAIICIKQPSHILVSTDDPSFARIFLRQLGVAFCQPHSRSVFHTKVRN
jgi:pseudouridylate synthase / pseudouridine kinase